MAQTQGKETLKITGSVDGNSLAYGGKVSFLTMKYERAIDKIQANTVALGYVEKYNVTYTFISATEGKNLPNEIIEKQPQDKFNVENGAKEQLEKYADVKVDGGVWKFRNWYVEKEIQQK